MVGFLVMNFSDSPPFKHLGNITAVGVGVAWLLSVSFLPALLSLLPIRAPRAPTFDERWMESLANFTIAHAGKLALAMSLLFAALVVSAFGLVVNDFPHRYFDETNDFRRGSDFLEQERGFYNFSMSVASTGSGGINDPEYLQALDRFEAWLRTQPHVVHVLSYAQIVKRLNRVMHGDDPAWYRLPDDRELAAQYLLLYEMLDLNDAINVDKSATKLDVQFQGAGLTDIKRVGLDAAAWLERDTTHAIPSQPTSYAVMFAYITENNVASMIQGTLIAFAIIALMLVASLRSVVLGFISLVPNVVPAAAAFGIWALLGLEGNFAVSVVASLSIGIIDDATVHFLSRYASARKELGCAPDRAVYDAFVNVGSAMLSNSIVIAGGFAVLMLSNFHGTVVIGALTSLTIACAMAADYLLLPPLLILLDRRKVGVLASAPAYGRS
jgi:predicted RND superfamily exporter protein